MPSGTESGADENPSQPKERAKESSRKNEFEPKSWRGKGTRRREEVKNRQQQQMEREILSLDDNNFEEMLLSSSTSKPAKW